MIFDGANVSRLEMIFLLLSIQAEKKISNTAMDAIFQAISEKVIPSTLNSSMPKSRAEARQVLVDIGLDYKVYDSCPCDQTLYYGPIKEKWTSCPKCKLSRYSDKTQKKNVPRKVSNCKAVHAILYCYCFCSTFLLKNMFILNTINPIHVFLADDVLTFACRKCGIFL